MKKLVLLTLVGILISWHAALAEENPCDGKHPTICEKNPEGNPICQILKQDATETVDSIIQFLRAIQSSFNEEEQEQLICARLMGRKRIEFLGNISYPVDRRFFHYSEKLSYDADISNSKVAFNFPVNPLILEWIKLEEKAARVLPGYILCPKNPKFAFVLQGDITKVSTNGLSPMYISIELGNVTIPDRKPIETRMQSLQKKINQYTKNVLNSGLDGQQADGSSLVNDMKKSGMVLVDDVGFVPPLTSMSQLELLDFSTGVEKEPSIERVLEEAYCKHSTKLGQRHAEWIQEHASEVPEEFKEHRLLFPGTAWKYSDGSRFLIPCLRWECCNNISQRYWKFYLCENDLNASGFRFLRFREQ